MEAVSAVFRTRGEAERALNAIQESGIPPERTTLLLPGSTNAVNQEVQSVPVDSTEQPGMGKAFGALTGGSVGLVGGSLLIALIPGLGPVSAMGLLGAAVLGAAGASLGASVGDQVERSSTQGLPEDEIFVYEDALRKGHSVVIALAEDEASAFRVRDLLKAEGAESLDAAREQWWIGLRGTEQARYTELGGNFADDEKFYRLGFEAALHSRQRCMEFDQVSAAMDAALEDVQEQYPDVEVEAPFTRGYMRGREYYQQLCDEGKEAA